MKGKEGDVSKRVGSWNPFEDTVSFGAVTEDFIFGRFLGRKETVFLKFVLFRGRI